MYRSATLAVAVAAVIGVIVPATAGASVQVSTSGWAWGNPTPQGNTIRAMDFVGTRGYAVGDDGTALRTDDGGTTWSGLATGTTANLGRVQAVDANTVVVLGGDGCVLRRSADAGVTFRRIYTPSEVGCPDRVAAASFVTPDLGYLVLRDGSVLRTTDGGQSFSKQTALPGTPASPGGGQATPVDVVLTSADAGIAFLKAGASSAAYATTDQGISWKPVDLPATGGPRRVVTLDAQTFALVGESEITTTTDQGKTWKRTTVPDAGSGLNGLDCAADTCVITTDQGDKLLRTTPKLEEFARVTPSTQAIFAAAFASPTRVVGTGAGGATVLSDDAGQNFTSVGGDIGGLYQRLRVGPTPTSAYAIGQRGTLARTTDAGASWKALSVPTSVNLVDVAFADATTGYALDASGGLFKTANAGQSWQTLDPGTEHASVVATLGGDTVMLVAQTGLRRQVGGGRFDPVGDRDVAKARLRDLDVNGSSTVAWGATAIAVTNDRGASWKPIPRPFPTKSRKVKKNALRIDEADFATARTGYVLDTAGRVWRTANAGRTWTRIDATGTADGIELAFGSADDGFLAIDRFGDDRTHAHVLHTTDGGRTWRPQLISLGAMPAGGIVAASAAQAYGLVGSAKQSRLFATKSGGDAGKASSLTINTKTRAFTKKGLKKAKGRIAVTGVLAGAQGGEQIVVSALDDKTGRWRHQTVAAGANGGSFTASWTIASSSRFVAQWAGDSGRTGQGSRVLGVTVK